MKQIPRVFVVVVAFFILTGGLQGALAHPNWPQNIEAAYSRFDGYEDNRVRIKFTNARGGETEVHVNFCKAKASLPPGWDNVHRRYGGPVIPISRAKQCADGPVYRDLGHRTDLPGTAGTHAWTTDRALEPGRWIIFVAFHKVYSETAVIRHHSVIHAAVALVNLDVPSEYLCRTGHYCPDPGPFPVPGTD